ncbi:MAG: DNA internalization-related competence protein ComEC/Rec2, partial [Oscillospiraceae bacterium]|nr:DNA internalization-related competence protein ComEC/Rec2 [Oscillospiraceae bacterium]
HTTVVRVDAQQTIAAGGISVHLYPEPCAGQEDGSMIVLASIGDYDTLVPGDVDTTAEAKFLSTCTYPDIELLFVGHHGSKRSTGDAWLDAIAPDAAIISVGYNSYGHPTSDTLERLQAHHIPIYRTDQMGDITVHLS